MLRNQSFHIRLDLETEPKPFLDYLIENSYSVVSVHEIATESKKHHYHTIVEGYRYKLSALRLAQKKYLGLTGSSYSISKRDKYHYEEKTPSVEGGYQYIFKGKEKGSPPIPFFNKHKGVDSDDPFKVKTFLSDEDIIEYHNKYWEINNKAINSKKTEGPVAQVIWDKLIQVKYFEENSWSNYKIKQFIIIDYYNRKMSIPAISNIDGILRYLYLRYRVEMENETLEQAVDYLMQCVYGISQFSEEGIRDHNCCQCHLDK